MNGTFSSYDKQIAELTPYLESSESDKVKDKIKELSLKKAKKCDALIEEAAGLYNQNKISLSTYMETVDEMASIKETTLSNGVEWYNEAVSAKVYDTALKELMALSVLGTKMVAGYMLTKAGKKYVRERLSKYTLLNEDAIDCRQFESDVYTLEEAVSKFHIKFNYAENWERSGKQTYVRVYFYNKKPIMAIAYMREKKDNVVNSKMNIETVLLDSRLKKHEDYYTAYMSAELQVNHPSIKRIMAKLKQQWKQASKNLDKEIQDNIDEAVENDTIDKKYVYISEACKEGYLTQEQVNSYTKRLSVRKKK